MWLPAPVYERIPQFNFPVGLLFITDGLYLEFEYTASFYYVGFGVASCAYGGAIRVMRIRFRRDRPAAEAAAPAVDVPAVDASAAVEESTAPADGFVADPSHEHSIKQ